MLTSSLFEITAAFDKEKAAIQFAHEQVMREIELTILLVEQNKISREVSEQRIFDAKLLEQETVRTARENNHFSV